MQRTNNNKTEEDLPLLARWVGFQGRLPLELELTHCCVLCTSLPVLWSSPRMKTPLIFVLKSLDRTWEWSLHFTCSNIAAFKYDLVIDLEGTRTVNNLFHKIMNPLLTRSSTLGLFRFCNILNRYRKYTLINVESIPFCPSSSFWRSS